MQQANQPREWMGWRKKAIKACEGFFSSFCLCHSSFILCSFFFLYLSKRKKKILINVWKSQILKPFKFLNKHLYGFNKNFYFEQFFSVFKQISKIYKDLHTCSHLLNKPVSSKPFSTFNPNQFVLKQLYYKRKSREISLTWRSKYKKLLLSRPQCREEFSSLVFLLFI